MIPLPTFLSEPQIWDGWAVLRPDGLTMSNLSWLRRDAIEFLSEEHSPAWQPYCRQGYRLVRTKITLA